MTNFDLIFDNAGGITLQTDDYCCHYNYEGQEKAAALGVSELLDGESTAGWDGDEPGDRLEYESGYDWLDRSEIEEALSLSCSDRELWLTECGGIAKREFFVALFELRGPSVASLIEDRDQRVADLPEREEARRSF